MYETRAARTSGEAGMQCLDPQVIVAATSRDRERPGRTWRNRDRRIGPAGLRREGLRPEVIGRRRRPFYLFVLSVLSVLLSSSGRGKDPLPRNP